MLITIILPDLQEIHSYGIINVYIMYTSLFQKKLKYKITGGYHMKQTIPKLFTCCPHEHENINCSHCHNYQYCLQKKQIRKLEKKIHNVHCLLNGLSVFLMFFLVITVILLWNVIHTIPHLRNEIELMENQIADLTEKISMLTIQSEPANSEQPQNYITENDEPKQAVLSSTGPSEAYYYDISYEDKVLIAKTVWVESGTECFEGQVAVAAVILNRFYSDIPYFDKESIESVITQPYQFADGSNVSMETLKAHPSCMEAVEAACKGWDPTRAVFSEGALYFYAPKLVKGYQKEVREGIRYLQIGNVNFHLDFEKVN